MKTLLTLLFLCLPLIIAAQDHQTEKPLLEHLATVNHFWQIQQFDFTERYCQETAFKTDNERIQKHLELVEQVLRSREDHHLTTAQKENRAQLLDILQEYQLNGKFPVNSHHINRQPYFIDKYGTACAVGHLMVASGHAKLAEEIAIENNYVFVEELLHDEKVLAWAAEYGFEWEELAWIQPGYPANVDWKPMDQGLNGSVKGIIWLGWPDSILIVGDFTAAGTTPVTNAAIWTGEKFIPAGSGLAGKINGIYRPSSGYSVAYGLFTHKGNTYNYAEWHGQDWLCSNRGPSGTGEITAIHHFLSDEYIAGFYFDSIEQKMVYYLEWDSLLIAELNGPVLSLSKGYDHRLIAAGKFNKLYNKWLQGTDDTIEVNNIFGFEHEVDGYDALYNGLDDTVWMVKFIGNALYAGGNFFKGKGQPSFAFARLLNGSWQQLIDPFDYSYDSLSGSIRDFIALGSEIVVAGEFVVHGGFNNGTHLAGYSGISGSMYSKGVFDRPVHTLYTDYSKNLIAGGDFEYEFPDQLNHIARYDLTSGVTDPELLPAVVVYPNPAERQLFLSSDQLKEYSDFQLRVFTVEGKSFDVPWTHQHSKISLDISVLSNGLYFYELTSEGKRLNNGRFVVQR